MLRVTPMAAILTAVFGTIAIVGVTGASAPRVTADPVTVTTTSGPIIGVVDGAIASFKGIPYAAPPVGPLRWRAPQPAPSWTTPRDATRFGAACPQNADNPMVGGGTASMSEDCLTANIWAPVHPARPAPVMVWIHGGGNSEGAGFRQYYDGASFARDGLVLVSINYRLGPLGFFAHPALTRAVPAGEPLGNFVLLDQLAALRWVKANIAAFGGDPAAVTVFGESAGGVDILDLMAVPAADGLFRRAIVESAGFFAHSIPLADAEAQGEQLAARVGVGDTAAQLRAISTDTLNRRSDDTDGPIVDGRLLTQAPIQRFADGHAIHVPLMIGTNSDEGSLRSDAAPPSDLLSRFPADALAAARTAYGGAPDDVTLARLLFRDEYFAAPARWIAKVSSESAPTFLYRFSYLRRSQRGRVPGASHGSEIPYVFDSWVQSPSRGSLLSAEDHVEASLIHACWASFARTGLPACDGAPVWPRYAAAADQLMDFDVTTSVRPTPDRTVLAFAEHDFVPARSTGR